MKILQWFSWVVGLNLLVLVLSSLVRGPYKQFPFVLVYCLALFFSTVVAISARVDKEFTDAAIRYYWVTDSLLQLLIFCAVISFIHQSITEPERRATVRRFLILGALLVSVGSLYFHYEPTSSFSSWMTSVSRDLNFMAAILDFLLWLVLISSRSKDHRLLIISGSLGIQFTGAAIGQSLRPLSAQARWAGNTIIILTSLFCLYGWWYAFRRSDWQNTGLQNRAHTHG